MNLIIDWFDHPICHEAKSKLSKSNLWGISSWHALQFDVLVDIIGRPSCWPSILPPSKSYKGPPCWTKMGQRSRSSDLVDRYVKMSVLSRRIKICIYILTFWPLSRSKGHKGQVLVMGSHGNHHHPRGQIEIPIEKKVYTYTKLTIHEETFAFTCICTGSNF